MRIATSKATVVWRFRRWLGETREEAKHTRRRSSTAVMSPPSQALRKENLGPMRRSVCFWPAGPDRAGSHGHSKSSTSTNARKSPRTSAHPLRLLFGHGAEGRPRCHQSPAALKQVGAIVGGDGSVAHGVRQRHLRYFGRKIRALSRPIAKARPKSVCRHIAPTHPPQQHQEHHVRKRSARLCPREHEGVVGMTMRLYLFQDGECPSG